MVGSNTCYRQDQTFSPAMYVSCTSRLSLSSIKSASLPNSSDPLQLSILSSFAGCSDAASIASTMEHPITKIIVDIPTCIFYQLPSSSLLHTYPSLQYYGGQLLVNKHMWLVFKHTFQPMYQCSTLHRCHPSLQHQSNPHMCICRRADQ